MMHCVTARERRGAATGHPSKLEHIIVEAFRIKAVPGGGVCTLVLTGEVDLAVTGDVLALGTASLSEPGPDPVRWTPGYAA
jgi:hypothetical protein